MMDAVKMLAAKNLRAKMKDVGHKSETIAEGPPKPRDKWYPSCSLTEKELPSLKGKKVGDKFVTPVEFEVTGTSQHDENPMKYNLDIKKIGVKGD